jgi:hypothetical protein
MMKRTSQIWTLVAAGAVAVAVLAPVGDATAADATKPNYKYVPRSSDPNGNDYHANYHADYSATQDGRRPTEPTEQNTNQDRDPRGDNRRFQDGSDRSTRPYGWRR